MFELCSRLFSELMLAFGEVSLARIKDILAKLVRDLALLGSATNNRLVNQVLGVVVEVGAQGDGSVNRFHNQ